MELTLFTLFAVFFGAQAGFIYDQQFESDEAFDISKHTKGVDSTIEFQGMTGSIGEKTFLNMKNVKHIRIFGGNLEQFDFEAFKKMPKLESLTLNGINTTIKVSSEDVKMMPKLKSFRLFAKMEEPTPSTIVEEDAFANTNLEDLYFHNFNIKILHKNRLSGMKNLKNLFFDFCNITTIDKDAFEEVPNLRTLGLKGNKAKIEPGTLQPLKRLKELNLINTGLKELHWETFSGLENLKMLKVDSNEITALKGTVPEELQNLEELDMAFNFNMDVKNVDWQFLLDSLPNLKRMNMEYCGISSIDGISNIKAHNIKKLNLKHNTIKEINWDILKNLPQLQKLDLSENNLQKIDTDKIIQYSKQLKKLSIHGNKDLNCDYKKQVKSKLQNAFRKIKVEINDEDFKCTK